MLAYALGGEWRAAGVSDALGRPVEARWLLLSDGSAVVEAAEAIGLARIAPRERDVLAASSRGLGELILAAASARPSRLVVCLGGTATMDAGAGLRAALGDRLSLPCPTTVLHDVRTALLDAPAVFGPQKGATPADVDELERRFRALDELRPFAELPGAGAAGGLGAALAALGGTLRPGAAYVLAAIGLRERARGAQLVVTGEGIVDATTAAGKAPGEVAALCRAQRVPCAVFGGRVRAAVPGAWTYELSGRVERAPADLVDLGARLGAAAVGGSVPP